MWIINWTSCLWWLLGCKEWDTFLCQVESQSTDGVAADSWTQARAHIHTSGSRCHSSGQSSISGCHTHMSNHQPVYTPPPPLLYSQKVARLARLEPHGLPVENHTDARQQMKYDVGKLLPFQDQNWNWRCVYKRNPVEENVLIIGCQTVPNIEKRSCYCSSTLAQSCWWRQHMPTSSANSLTNFLQQIDAWCHSLLPGATSSQSAIAG